MGLVRSVDRILLSPLDLRTIPDLTPRPVRGGCRRSSVRRAAVGGPGQNRGKDVTSRREFR